MVFIFFYVSQRQVFGASNSNLNEEVFRLPIPKRGQSGYRTVRIIEVPGSMTWGGGAGPYLWVIWVITLNPSSQQKKLGARLPRDPHPPCPLPPPTCLPVSTDDIWAVITQPHVCC